ncbi:outer membrane protein assembly factor BamB family protein [Halosimplex halophilum]|uniref:outer membrane protein assembly factor BamB family protein n=1 Tax=Halosimplex halophilum TaxID=2559572 RepID=UPI00107F9D76|nr:PQQ-binding-like beta-propeller repeat protein [Halosimplex halophilum]
MVPDSSLSRRQVLASGGAAGALLGGGVLARRLLPTAAGRSPDGWPMVARDPGGTAYAPEADPPTDGVKVRWKYGLPPWPGADVRPAPVVAGGVVYAVGPHESMPPHSPELVALSASEGSVLARARRPVRSAPAVAPARAYRARTVATLETPTFDPHRLVGLPGADAGTGGWLGGGESAPWTGTDATRWTASVDADSDSYSRIRFGGATTPPPVAVGDALVTFFRGTLAAVDGSSGAVRWTSDEGLPATRPAVRDGAAYVVGPDRGVRSYDLATGASTDLSVDLPGRPMYLAATPARLYVAGQGWVSAHSFDGSADWRATFPEGASVPAGPVAVADGTVYVRRADTTATRLCALDADDGSVRWVCEGVTPSEAAYLPAATDDAVYVPTDAGGLAAVDADDGSVRWRFDPGTEPCSPAAIVDDAVYVVGSEHLYALEEP